jgi:hypothetical protein
MHQSIHAVKDNRVIEHISNQVFIGVRLYLLILHCCNPPPCTLEAPMQAAGRLLPCDTILSPANLAPPTLGTDATGSAKYRRMAPALPGKLRRHLCDINGIGVPVTNACGRVATALNGYVF